MYQAVTTGDIKTFGDMLADDVEMENVGPKTLPYTGHWRGANEMLGAVERNFKYLTVLKPEILSIVAQGDTVVVIGREVGVYLPTGRQYEADWVQQLTFADGKLKRFRQVIDASDILEGVFAERHR